MKTISKFKQLNGNADTVGIKKTLPIQKHDEQKTNIFDASGMQSPSQYFTTVPFLLHELCSVRYMPWWCVSVCHKPALYQNDYTHDHAKNATRWPRDSNFLMPKNSSKFERGLPQRGHQMQVG